LICINVLLYIAGFRLTDDILTRFYSINNDDKITGFSTSFNDTLPSDVLIAGQSEGGLEVDPGTFRITDIPKMLFGIFKFLFNIMFAPVALFLSPQLNLPIEIQFMIAIPFGIIMFFLVVGWWRGGSD
jgi:hypothetical protein